MKQVAILISGGGSNMVALARSLADSAEAQVSLVVSNKPDAGGLARAQALGIATEVVDHRAFAGDRRAFERALHGVLEAANPDVICLAGFMRVLSADFVAPWEGRMLNIHPSLLPKYKGLHTHQRAIEAGDAEAGCCVHEVTAELDGGPILGQARVPILPDDTPETLAARILPLEHRLYPAVLARFLAGNRALLQLS